MAACAAIGRARAQGSQVFALYLTHGCVARDVMWPWAQKSYEATVARRRKEGEEAARVLGIVPVGWSSRPARHLWRELPEVCREIEAAIEKHAIDQLWMPAYEGGNADHDALNAVASRFAPKTSALEFAEYNFLGGKAHSHEFPRPNGGEQTIMLTPEERQKKHAALAIYQSEQCNLGYVRTEREVFRPLATYDYSRPPHDGTLWYARFQWVPLRHPRVDFTKPREVCGAITDFLYNHPT